MTYPPVPFAPDVAAALTAFLQQSGAQGDTPPPPLTMDTVAAARAQMAGMFPPAAAVCAGKPVTVDERVIDGPDGNTLEITVISPAEPAEPAQSDEPTKPAPCLYNIHGGGMMIGHRNMDTLRLLDLVRKHGAVAVNVEYRLAPEHPHPAPVEDCYAGLTWTAAHAAELGIDPARIVVIGGSAGGGLAAATALMARDRKGPALAGQLLLCPMIDDTNTTVSSLQYDGIGTWPRANNLLGWQALVGDAAGTDAVSPYAAPTRGDAANLPPAFIEVGSAEMFRDEDTNYALAIWATGGTAELHVWSGGCHGFDIYAPDAAITRAALAARDSWLQRVWQG